MGSCSPTHRSRRTRERTSGASARRRSGGASCYEESRASVCPAGSRPPAAETRRGVDGKRRRIGRHHRKGNRSVKKKKEKQENPFSATAGARAADIRAGTADSFTPPVTHC